MYRQRRSLRNKIITRSFVPAAVILVAVALVSLVAYQRVTENLVIERDRDLTQLSAKLLSDDLTSYTNPFADQYLAIFDGILLFDAKRNLLAAEPMQYQLTGLTWFRNLSLDQMFESDRPIFSDVMEDQLTGQKLIAVIMPMGSQTDKPQGAMAGFFRLDTKDRGALGDKLEQLRRRESNCIYLVDGRGRVIYHSESNHIGQDFSEQPAVDRLRDGEAGALRTRDLEDQDIIASFAPVPGTPYGLVMEESWATLTRFSRRYGQLLLVLLALGVVIPTVIVNVGVNRITQPIGQLIRAAQDIAGGHFSRRIEASTGDELEELAQQFNRMASQLQESYAHLEQKVADRTRELATLNDIAAQASYSLKLSEILGNSLDEVLNAVSMHVGQAFRVDDESQTLVSVAHRGLPEGALTLMERLPLANSMAMKASQRGQSVVQAASALPDIRLRELMEGEGLELMVCVPLMAHRRMVGAIHLASRTLRSLSPEELSLLASIGHQLGIAVDNARLYEQAQELAVIKERTRLARDLHDSVTQALYGVTLYSEAATRQLLAGDLELVAEHLQEIRSTAQESLREMRLLIFELRLPALKSDGLVAALQARLESVEAKVGLSTVFDVDGDSRLRPEVEEGLYRIAQEALNNILKHAHATRVSVRVGFQNGAACLQIADDGEGFDPLDAQAGGGFGLRGMEERAARLGGKLNVRSRPGQGTCIEVEVCQ